jgi:hypothetical protein
VFKRLYLSTFLATLTLSPAFASDINSPVENKAPNRFASAATQANLDNQSCDCVFNVGNDIFQAVSGTHQIFEIEQQSQEPIINKKEGPHKGKQWIKDGVPQFKTVTHKHKFYLAAEQTTAHPHLTFSIYTPQAGALSLDDLNVMKAQMDQQRAAVEQLGCLFEDGMRAIPKGLVYIVKFRQDNTPDITFMDDRCPFGNFGAESENVYYRLNDKHQLVDKDGNKFTDAKKDMSRSFIALECDIMRQDGSVLSADQFMAGMEPALDLKCPNVALSRKVYAEPLIHITLAKISGTKDNKAFRATSNPDLLFPVKPAGFIHLQQVVRAANTSWDKHKQLEFVADNLVFNPVDAEFQEHAVKAFHVDAKQRAHANDSWDKPHRRQISLVAQPKVYALGTDEANALNLTGFRDGEVSHRWTVSNLASMTFSNNTAKPLFVQFKDTSSHFSEKVQEQKMTVFRDGVETTALTYTLQQNSHSFVVTIPANTPSSVIAFALPNAHVPAGDASLLGVAFKQMVVSHKPFTDGK